MPWKDRQESWVCKNAASVGKPHLTQTALALREAMTEEPPWRREVVALTTAEAVLPGGLDHTPGLWESHRLGVAQSWPKGTMRLPGCCRVGKRQSVCSSARRARRPQPSSGRTQGRACERKGAGAGLSPLPACASASSSPL